MTKASKTPSFKRGRRLTAKQEAYAQGLAKGLKQVHAYAAAGFQSSSTSGPSALAKDPRITARVAEIQAKRDNAEAKAIEKAVKAVSLDREWVLRALMEDREKARELQQMASAIRADELLGREISMFIERKDLTIRRSPLEAMTNAELEQLLAKLGSLGPENGDQAGVEAPGRTNGAGRFH